MRRIAWWLTCLATVVSITVVAIPAWLIQPFRAQSRAGIEWSYQLRAWAPGVTLVAAAIVAVLGVLLWRGLPGRRARVLLGSLLALALLLSLLARQNHFEWRFQPLREKAFVAAHEVDFLADDDMVLAVGIGRESVAFPVRQLAYNHVVQDVIDGTPIVATY